MSERIKGSYDDALYKLTFTLLYFTLLYYVTSHPGQLSLLPSVGREMSAGQSAVMLCGWE